MASLLIGGIALTVDKIKESRAKRRASRPNSVDNTKRASVSSTRSLSEYTATEMQARMLHKYNTDRFNTHPLHRAPMGDGEDEEDAELPGYSTEGGAPPGYRETGPDEETERRTREARERLELQAVAEAKVRSFGGTPGGTAGWGWA